MVGCLGDVVAIALARFLPALGTRLVGVYRDQRLIIMVKQQACEERLACLAPSAFSFDMACKLALYRIPFIARYNGFVIAGIDLVLVRNVAGINRVLRM